MSLRTAIYQVLDKVGHSVYGNANRALGRSLISIGLNAMGDEYRENGKVER